MSNFQDVERMVNFLSPPPPDAPHQTLHTLTLHLSFNKIRDAGAQAHLAQFACLGKSTTLHTLTLNLTNNVIEDAGAEALARLGESTTLHTLALNLRCNCIRQDGAKALARLGESTTLQTLTLDLWWQWGSGIEDACAEALARLGESNTLHTLTLNLQLNKIGDARAEGMPVWANPPRSTP